ncbi:hypothetical protein [Streptomyces sp. NPDC005485]|uniref:hypothetical protein n=1 Tax=Streptomyces sp. NPDC005485 TaxID=3155591 RepID=UPI0033AF13E1
MWSLTVTDSAVMEATADALPAVAAMGRVYTVLAWPYPQETVLFQSADPVEAVEFTARLIEKQRAG